MDEDITCGVCSEQYNSQKYEPVQLPCGHTFCRSCLLQLHKNNKLDCPTCRTSDVISSIEKLPCNFTVLSMADNQTEYEKEMCRDHDGMVLSLWCRQCQQPLCGMCVYNAHPRDSHDVVPSKVIMLEKKECIEGQADEINSNIKNMKTGSHHSVEKALKTLLSILKFNSDIEKLNQELKENTANTRKVQGIEATLVCEAKGKSLHEMLEELSSVYAKHHRSQYSVVTSSDGTPPGSVTEVVCPQENFDVASITELKTGSCITKTGNFTKGQGETKTGNLTKGQGGTSTSESLISLWPLKIGVHKGKSGWSTLFWDGKLFLPAFAQQVVDAHLIVQWELLRGRVSVISPQVFLEVSVAGQLVGRVYIRLWGHLRRAQHFWALCLGTLGPSYTGSHLTDGRKEGLPQSPVWGGHYNGGRDCQGLMDNLEWGGEYSGSAREGLVVAGSGGKKASDALFSVYTSQTSDTCACPFGEVVSGLEILRKAVCNNPEDTVTIPRCGAVLEEFEDQ